MYVYCSAANIIFITYTLSVLSLYYNISIFILFSIFSITSTFLYHSILNVKISILWYISVPQYIVIFSLVCGFFASLTFFGTSVVGHCLSQTSNGDEAENRNKYVVSKPYKCLIFPNIVYLHVGSFLQKCEGKKEKLKAQ